MEFPEPVIHVAIEPKTKADQDKLGKALYSLSEEDPTFRVRTDDETGQTVISGMGELHLEVLVDRMLREFSVDATVGKPQVAYRETITKPVDNVEYRHVKQTGGSGQFAVRQDRPRAHRPRRRLRVRRQDQRRPHPPGVHPRRRPGHPVGPRRRRARRLPDGRRPGHARRRPVPRRRLVARWPSRSPARWPSRRRPRSAKPVLLEPIMSVEVVTPEDYMGDVIGDLSSRRGRIEGMEARGNTQVVRAQVPLSEMFGYSTDLRSRTQGRATYTMQFHSYQQVPETHRLRDRQAGPGRVASAPPTHAFLDNPRSHEEDREP